MDPNQNINQLKVNPSEKSGILQSQPPPQLAFQGNPGVQPTYNQPVLQPVYIQAPYPGQSVVTLQPTVYMANTNKVRDYMGYSIFTMLCCFLPLGIAALIFSCSTRDAIFAGQQEIARKNSRTARILNHVTLGIGIFLYSLLIIIVVVSSIRH